VAPKEVPSPDIVAPEHHCSPGRREELDRHEGLHRRQGSTQERVDVGRRDRRINVGKEKPIENLVPPRPDPRTDRVSAALPGELRTRRRGAVEGVALDFLSSSSLSPNASMPASTSAGDGGASGRAGKRSRPAKEAGGRGGEGEGGGERRREQSAASGGEGGPSKTFLPLSPGMNLSWGREAGGADLRTLGG